MTIGYSNADYLTALNLIRAARRGDESVLLDPMLFQVKTAGGGKASTNFAWLLAVSRIPGDAPAELPDQSRLVGRLAILHRNAANRLDRIIHRPRVGMRKVRASRSQRSRPG